ncbi:MAG: helix-turn-helix domain-containing protein [Bifidobacteriaceae bacterium]|nr:helix-turn-helix domain-containing protein [Bifidobacteriaceae bacterium]
MRRYTVQVTREGDKWLGEVVGLAGAHTFAGSLLSLDKAIREVIALVEDLPTGAEAGLDLDWDFSAVSPEAVRAGALGGQRRRHERAHRSIVTKTQQTVVQLAQSGWSHRDIAAVLGISPGRVSRVLREHSAPGGQEM